MSMTMKNHVVDGDEVAGSGAVAEDDRRLFITAIADKSGDEAITGIQRVLPGAAMLKERIATGRTVNFNVVFGLVFIHFFQVF